MPLENIEDLQQFLEGLKLSNSPGAEKFTLLQKILVKLQLTKIPCFIITVAGTNGKGTVTHLLEAFFLEAGYDVGCIVSPHVQTINERIRINGEMISDAQLLSYCHEVIAVDEAGDLGYSINLMLIAFLHFQKQQPDIVILEVGLGGRYDCTNSYDADIAVLTSIDYDHCDILGDTLDKIGYQKAGIFRTAKPAVIAAKPCPATVTDYAKTIAADVMMIDQDFKLTTLSPHQFSCKNKMLNDLIFSGSLYLDNVAAALAVLMAAEKFPVSDKVIKKVLARFQMPGRCQVIIDGDVTVIIDVAHNPASVRNLSQFVESNFQNKPISAIMAVKQKKDVTEMLSVLKPLISQWCIPEIADEMLLSSTELSQQLQKLEIEVVKQYPNLERAYQGAKEITANDGIVLVFGSFIIAGEMLTMLQQGATNG